MIKEWTGVINCLPHIIAIYTRSTSAPAQIICLEGGGPNPNQILDKGPVQLTSNIIVAMIIIIMKVLDRGWSMLAMSKHQESVKMKG